MALVFSYIASQACLSQERSCMAGLDLTAFLRSSVQAEVSYSFNRHWSLGGEACVTYKRLAKGKSELEQEHDREFDSASSISAEPFLQSGAIVLSYWPDMAFKGLHLSVGVRADEVTDIITEAGYTLSLWKDICLSIGLRVPIIQSISEGSIDAKAVTLGINYRF
jgi:hypothetical protein